MNDIESRQQNPACESRLHREQRLRQERRKKFRVLSITGLASFSLTLAMGLATQSTYSIFTDSEQPAHTLAASEDFCAEADDTHQNGDDHPDPPGNGYGHCKDHNNNGEGNDDKGPQQGGAPYGDAIDPKVNKAETESDTEPADEPAAETSDSVPEIPEQQDETPETPSPSAEQDEAQGVNP